MPRSNYIYLVVSGIEHRDFRIHGLFTVWHESCSYMELLGKEANPYNLRILKSKDGYPYDPNLVLTIREIANEQT
jgi:hypothetical protein